MRHVMQVCLNHVFIVCITVLFVGSMTNQVIGEAQAESLFDHEANVPVDKEWLIQFSDQAHLASVTGAHIYVKDKDGNRVDVQPYLLEDGKKVAVTPPLGGYEPHTYYRLVIGEDVYSKSSVSLEETAVKTFTTGSDDHRITGAFIPREDSSNELIYQDEVTAFDEEVTRHISHVALGEDVVIFDESYFEQYDLQVGDIFVLPPDDAYPYGWAKKIVRIDRDRDEVRVLTSEPQMEEVLLEVDVSQVIPVTPDDFTIDSDVMPGMEVSTMSTDEELIFIQEQNPSHRMTIDTDGEHPRVTFENIRVLTGDDLQATVVLHGEMVFAFPEINLDLSRLSLERLAFSSGIEKSLTLEFPDGNYNRTERIPTGLRIPVKAYGVAGAEVSLDVFASAKGDVEVSVGLVQELSVEAGIDREGSHFHPFNRSVYLIEPVLNHLRGDLTGRVGMGVGIQAQVLQFNLGGITLDGGYQIDLNGEVRPNMICYRIADSGFIEANATVGLSGYELMDYTFPVKAFPLNDYSNCDLVRLGTNYDHLELEQGEQASLSVFGVDFLNNRATLALPDANLSFESSLPDHVRVNPLGGVRVSPNTPGGSEAEITIVYNNGKGEDITASVYVSVPEDVPAMIEPDVSFNGNQVQGGHMNLIGDQLYFAYSGTEMANGLYVLDLNDSDSFPALLVSGDINQIVIAEGQVYYVENGSHSGIYRYDPKENQGEQLIVGSDIENLQLRHDELWYRRWDSGQLAFYTQPVYRYSLTDGTEVKKIAHGVPYVNDENVIYQADMETIDFLKSAVLDPRKYIVNAVILQDSWVNMIVHHWGNDQTEYALYRKDASTGEEERIFETTERIDHWNIYGDQLVIGSAWIRDYTWIDFDTNKVIHTINSVDGVYWFGDHLYTHESNDGQFMIVKWERGEEKTVIFSD